MDEPHKAARAIQSELPGFTPRLAMVLGSGLGAVADSMEEMIAIPYGALPGFPIGHVAGHAGTLILGTLAAVPVAVLKGRAHMYEGTSWEGVKNFVRTLKLIGCEALLLTNAAGSFHVEMPPGSLMLVNDHINLFPSNPLVGPNDDEYGPRFPVMEGAYDPELLSLLRAAARRMNVGVGEGVYLGTLGPAFETPAEIRAFAALGADAVGMSTVPECIVARHCGLRVAAISAITNLASGMAPAGAHGHEQTLAQASGAAADMAKLILAFLEDFSRV